MLDFQVAGGIACLTLQRPTVLNAINQEMANLFSSRVEELESRSDVRVVVTRGEGRAFCAGSGMSELAPLSAEEAANYELRFATIFPSLDRLPQPTIAVLHGHVLGGGLGLAMYHDFRIASTTACLGMSGSGTGLDSSLVGGTTGGNRRTLDRTLAFDDLYLDNRRRSSHLGAGE